METWKKWWRRKRESNDALLTAAQNGEVAAVVDILNPTKHQDLIADINCTGLDDWNALHFAASEGFTEVARALLDREINVDARSSLERTPLHLACIRGHVEIVTIVLEYGAELNAVDFDLNTPVHFASEFGHIRVLEALLGSGCELGMRNNLGYTPSDIAMNIEVRKVFNEHQQQQESPLNTSYSRTEFHNVLLYNDRKSSVQKLMGKFSNVNKILASKNANEEALIKNLIDREA